MASYTLEWTNIVIEFIRKQLAEIFVPLSISTTRAGNKLKPKSIVDSDFRQTWTAKFSYSLVIYFFSD